MIDSQDDDPLLGVDRCASEPVHLIGHIQSHGLLFALSEPDFSVRQVSANTGVLLGLPPEAVLGRSLEVVLGAQQFELFRSRLRTYDMVSANPLRVTIGGRALEMNCIAHRQDGALIAEFELLDGAYALEPLKLATGIQVVLARLEQASNLLELAWVAASETRRLSGFDRVMVYRFDPEWNGEVMAESAAASPISYLGLRFPSSDIPAQARRLFLMNPLRAIADVGSTPVPIVPKLGPLTGRALDLSFSFLRSAAPIHIEFLRNMGVGSTMTVSIIVQERLWGMIACHHPCPHHVDSSIRSVCELVGRNLALHMALRTYRADAQSRLTSRELLENYVAGIGSSQSPVDAKSLLGPRLLGFLDADGLVSRIDGVVSYHGVTVPEESLSAVLSKLRKLQVRGIASSNMLSALDRSATAYADKVSGALYLALSEQLDAYLLFLRREIVETVTWAGDPNPGVGVDAAGKPHPRKSFAAWQEILRARARPWTELELESANLLREKLLRMRDAKRLRKLEALLRHSPSANDGHRSTRR